MLVLDVGTLLRSCLTDIVIREGEEGEGVDIRVSIEIGYSVVCIVAIIPPPHGETKHDIAGEPAHKVAMSTTLENTVVVDLVGDPTKLLPHGRNNDTTNDWVALDIEPIRKRCHCKGGKELVKEPKRVCLEEALVMELFGENIKIF